MSIIVWPAWRKAENGSRVFMTTVYRLPRQQQKIMLMPEALQDEAYSMHCHLLRGPEERRNRECL